MTLGNSLCPSSTDIRLNLYLSVRPTDQTNITVVRLKFFQGALFRGRESQALCFVSQKCQIHFSVLVSL